MEQRLNAMLATLHATVHTTLFFGFQPVESSILARIDMHPFHTHCFRFVPAHIAAHTVLLGLLSLVQPVNTHALFLLRAHVTNTLFSCSPQGPTRFVAPFCFCRFTNFMVTVERCAFVCPQEGGCKPRVVCVCVCGWCFEMQRGRGKVRQGGGWMGIWCVV